MYDVIIKAGGRIYKIQAEQGQNLMHLIRKANININSICNGNGTCGKCKVRILSGYLPDASENELARLGSDAVEAGFRFSCSYSIVSDIEVLLENSSVQAQIVTEGRHRTTTLLPIVSKENVILQKPDLSCQKADFERVTGNASSMELQNIQLLRMIPELIRESGYNITLVKAGTHLLGVEAGNTIDNLYGAAFDIGTTTIAAYLFKFTDGKRLCVHSDLNPQRIFGADIISRIKHTIDEKDGLQEMHTLIINEINSCINAMCEKANIERTGIYAVTFAGNTTMLHFLLNISASNIASAPFIPAVTSMLNIGAKELGIEINACGIACVLPSVSAYIGADTVGAVLSTGMYRQEEISLLIDIGTNGEIVLGNNDNLYACSSAAGPAFEGAGIRNGIGSVEGAITGISLHSGIQITTIGDTSPIGICGTGIVDAAAQMLETGLIDETGRFNENWQPTSEENSCIAERLSVIDGIKALQISRDIAITQKDIRELQNAKAAIAAGINVLVKQAGISFDDIKNVYLAGGFGSFINVNSALKISLLPGELTGKVTACGNAAGAGAIMALISKASFKRLEAIKEKTTYIELSGNNDFVDFYIESMMF